MVKTNSIDSSLTSSPSENNNLRALLVSKLAGLCMITLGLFGGSLLYTNQLMPIPTIGNVIVGSIIGYITSGLLLSYLSKYPGNRLQSYLIPITTIVFLLLLVAFLFSRIEYSRYALAIALPLTYLSLYLEQTIFQRITGGVYAVVPIGFYQPLIDANHKKFKLIDGISDHNINQFKGIIVDKNEKLPDIWQRYIANALANDINVLDTVHAFESMTGKSPLDHYGEIASSDITPKKLTLFSKRIIESALILLTSPITAFIVLITAIVIKLESKGPAFFIQKRVGRGGREFDMYKLRSMCTESEKDGARFASKGDARITRVGHIIRKTRIDELPQFLNVLKGDMALIGPRPEQATFVKQFEIDIPLYSYRHVVRPGITGWAQVTHGYAANEDETREKLAHDFFYVKNLSLWLDLDIIFKTIKTMITGFGAR